jgi:hypothetical protein
MVKTKWGPQMAQQFKNWFLNDWALLGGHLVLTI